MSARLLRSCVRRADFPIIPGQVAMQGQVSMNVVTRHFVGENGFDWKKSAKTMLRVAPWVTFGPITGFLTERAIRCGTRGEPILAGLYVILNIAILLAIPALTASIAAHI